MFVRCLFVYPDGRIGPVALDSDTEFYEEAIRQPVQTLADILTPRYQPVPVVVYQRRSYLFDGCTPVLCAPGWTVEELVAEAPTHPHAAIDADRYVSHMVEELATKMHGVELDQRVGPSPLAPHEVEEFQAKGLTKRRARMLIAVKAAEVEQHEEFT
jgi:hypothetical protein